MARWPARVALAVALAASALVAFAQPVGSPWWTYADADASYAASSLNLLLGRRVPFVDHPGLPLTELGAAAFAVDAVVHGHGPTRGSRLAYVRKVMLDLDRARPVFRGVAIALYLLGALLAFLLVGRLLGHWTWGLAAGLLWIAAPGLAAMSIQFRPDVLLAVLCLAFAYLIGRAVDERSASHYAAAAVVTGVAVMVKLHAGGLLVPLALAVLWRPPPAGWWPRLRADVSGRVRRRPVAWATLGAGWLAVALLLNADRGAFSPTRAQLTALAGVVLPVAALLVLAWAAARWGRPALAAALSSACLVAGALVAGLLLPVTLEAQDGLAALVNIAKATTGGGVNEEVASFARPFWDVVDIVPRAVVGILVLAAIAGALGLVRRDPRPVVWSTGALAMFVLAFARPPAVHYFAPAFALSIPAMLWALQRGRRGAASLLVWPVVLFVVWPVLRDREAPTLDTERFAALVTPSREAVEARLQSGEFALVPPFWPFPDSRWFELVRTHVDYAPERRFRYLPTTATAASFASVRELRPRYYVGPLASGVEGEGRVSLDALGEYRVRRLPEADLLLELLSGRGVDRLWERPDAVYDPWTGYFKDPAGRYWTRERTVVPHPPRRRYLRERGVWVDMFGDLWDRRGTHVGTDASLRTAG